MDWYLRVTNVTLEVFDLVLFRFSSQFDQYLQAVQLNNLALAMRPVPPECLGKILDHQNVNAWRYRMVKLFTRMRTVSHVQVGDVEVIAFASSGLKDNATVWWYNIQVMKLCQK